MANLAAIIGVVGLISIVPTSIYIWSVSTSDPNPKTNIENEIISEIEPNKEIDVDQEQEKNLKEINNIFPTQTDSEAPLQPIANNPEGKKYDETQNSLMINLQAGSVGNKFKDYLIESRDDELWNKKLNIWEQFSKDTKRKESLTTYFMPKKSEKLTKELLQRKCRSAYLKKKWEIFVKRNQSFMNEWYWNTAYHLCGQDKQMPWNWGRGAI